MMNNDRYKISVGSDQEHEDLVAEVIIDGFLFADISQEKGIDNLDIRLYFGSETDCSEMSLQEFFKIIDEAKNKLWNLQKSSG